MKSKRRKLRDYLDTLWSEITKNVHGRKCSWCNSTEKIQSDHIVSRANYRTRWAIENCVILCRTCHIFRKRRDPIIWANIAIEVRGDATVEALIRQSNSKEKVDLNQVKTYLESLAKTEAA